MADGWLPDLDGLAGAKYAVIADALAAAIDRGDLPGGTRLPPQRDLATRLGVDLTTVTRAYDAARRRGLIEARGRAGSFVRAPQRVEIADLARVDTGMNLPPELPGGLLARTIAETVQTLLLDASPLRLQYQAMGGSAEDRAAGVRFLDTLGLAAEPDQLILAAGGQNALHAILGVALRPGDAILCRTFVYSGLRALAQRMGLRLLGLETLDATSIAAACAAEPGIRAIYLVPTNDNPTAETLDKTARREIAAAAARHDLQLIEDDAYGPLAASPLAPVAASAPDRSWYIASASKIISPALRVAFVRAPNLAAALQLSAQIHQSAVMAPPLNAAMLTRWIDDGTAAHLVAAMRDEAARRQALAAQLLAGLDFTAHPQGYHLWLRLPGAVAPDDLADAMRPTGLSVMPANRFATNGAQTNAVRVSLGGLADDDQLARALRILHGHAATI
ncbi:PLP-dependent aminotransferase family protein [Sphingomonas sp.]|uniref:aminotransferase-like domain-containing protein n=1 Tax=Sphingomonas sp. TaxID=28214 RepID=UPI002ED93D82